MPIRAVVQRHQLSSYFLLTYGITWGGILILLTTKAFQFNALSNSDLFIMFFFMVLGPSTGSIGLTALLTGYKGLRSMWQRLTRWRLRLLWYAVGLLPIPVLILMILLCLSRLVSPVFMPGFQIAGLAIGLVAGGLEEIGWTDFATPRLLNKYQVLPAGLMLGLVWALWHSLADFSGNIGTMGYGWLLWFFIFWMVPLPAYRLFMTWVYANTESLLLAQLMHASYTGWLLVLSPTDLVYPNLLWQSVFAVSLWVLAGGITILTGSKVSRPKLV